MLPHQLHRVAAMVICQRHDDFYKDPFGLTNE